MIATSSIALVFIILLVFAGISIVKRYAPRVIKQVTRALEYVETLRHRKALHKEEIVQIKAQTALIEEEKRNAEIWTPNDASTKRSGNSQEPPVRGGKISQS